MLNKCEDIMSQKLQDYRSIGIQINSSTGEIEFVELETRKIVDTYKETTHNRRIEKESSSCD